jgi:hypothetical protein
VPGPSVANATASHRRRTGANKVQLLSSEHHLSQVQGSKTWEAGTTYIRSQHHICTGKTLAGKTKDGPSWARALHPQHPMRMTSQLWAQWHRWSTMAREPTRLRISNSCMHQQMQMRVPSRTKHTSVRPNYGGQLDTPLTSVRGRIAM